MTEYAKVIAAQVMCAHCKALLSTQTLEGELVYYHSNGWRCPNADKFFVPSAVTLWQWGKEPKPEEEEAV